jgi:hypothetical protein
MTVFFLDTREDDNYSGPGCLRLGYESFSYLEPESQLGATSVRVGGDDVLRVA